MSYPMNIKQHGSHVDVDEALRTYQISQNGESRFSFSADKVGEGGNKTRVYGAEVAAKYEGDRLYLTLYSLPNGERLLNPKKFCVLRAKKEMSGEKCWDAHVEFARSKEGKGTHVVAFLSSDNLSSEDSLCARCTSNCTYRLSGESLCARCAKQEVWTLTMTYEARRCMFLLHHQIKTNIHSCRPDGWVADARDGTVLQVSEEIDPIERSAYELVPWVSVPGTTTIAQKVESVAETLQSLMMTFVNSANFRRSGGAAAAAKFPVLPGVPDHVPETDGMHELRSFREHGSDLDLLRHLRDGVYTWDGSRYSLKLGGLVESLPSREGFAEATQKFNDRVRFPLHDLATDDKYKVVPYAAGAAQIPACRACGRPHLSHLNGDDTCVVKCEECQHVYCDTFRRDTWCVPVTRAEAVRHTVDGRFPPNFAFRCVGCRSRASSPVTVLDVERSDFDLSNPYLLRMGDTFRVDKDAKLGKYKKKRRVRFPRASELLVYEGKLDGAVVVKFECKKKKRKSSSAQNVRAICQKISDGGFKHCRVFAGGHWRPLVTFEEE